MVNRREMLIPIAHAQGEVSQEELSFTGSIVQVAVLHAKSPHGLGLKQNCRRAEAPAGQGHKNSKDSCRTTWSGRQVHMRELIQAKCMWTDRGDVAQAQIP